MTKTELLAEMESLGACEEATKFVSDHASDCANEIGQSCTNVDWLVWFLARKPEVQVQAFAFACADRAVRIYAPEALERAGLKAEAQALRDLPAIVDVETARGADYAAHYAAAHYAAAVDDYAADAARYARDAHYAASRAAASRAAAAAAYARYAARYAARVSAVERKIQLKALHEMWGAVCH